MLRRIAVAVAAGLVLCAAWGRADEPSLQASDCLHRGARALQFATRFLGVSKLQGSTLSYKALTGARSGYRLGITVEAGKEQIDSKERPGGEPADSSPGYTANFSKIFLQLSAERLHYFEPFHRAAGYFAFGPFVNYRHQTARGFEAGGAEFPDGYYTSVFPVVWGIGGTFRLGVEVFAIRNLSFESSYGLSAGYDHARRRIPSIGVGYHGEVVERIEKNWSVSPTEVSLAASLYFH